MQRRPLRTMFTLALASVNAACASDIVEFGYYGAPEDDAAPAPLSPEPLSTLPPLDAAVAVDAGDAATAGALEGGTPKSSACDLNGRWLVASRVLADALGQKQASHNWFYYEIRQDADQVTVT